MQSERTAFTSADELVAEARRLRVEEAVAVDPSVRSSVEEIVADVAARGDLALDHWVAVHDSASVGAGVRKVDPALCTRALTDLAPELIDALTLAITNARVVAGCVSNNTVEQIKGRQGQLVTSLPLPVEVAAVYVPGGRNPFPSSLIMGVTAAQAAGVDQVVACARPLEETGEIHEAILATAALLKVTLFRMGGPHAIAAFAFGTDSVPKADVVVGPGNEYVVEAKRQVLGQVGIDSLAGPSELVIIASDEVLTAEGAVGALALDLGAQAEHGPLSPVVALSTSAEVLDALASELARIDAPQTERPVQLIHAPSYQACAAFANAYAPEHLQLAGSTAEKLIKPAEGELTPQVRAAGCVFVGAAAGTAFGDYVAGSNHVLPTAGAARYSSALSPLTFTRQQEIVEISPESAAKLADAGATIAEAEGFPLHQASMLARKQENQNR